jgi:hypothetical protein
MVYLDLNWSVYLTYSHRNYNISRKRMNSNTHKDSFNKFVSKKIQSNTSLPTLFEGDKLFSNSTGIL